MAASVGCVDKKFMKQKPLSRAGEVSGNKQGQNVREEQMHRVKTVGEASVTAVH